MSRKPVPWLIRSVLAGAAGTAAMTLAYVAEHHLRRRVKAPLDYDDSLVPGTIVASILRLDHVTGQEENELGLGLRWGYGSAFGVAHTALRLVVPEPWASVGFGSALAHNDLFPLSAPGPHAAALALACGRHGHVPGNPCRLRGDRRRRG